jgi:hypothetical protein
MMESIFRTFGLIGLVGSPFPAAADSPQYPTRSAAEETCPGQIVVWVDLTTRIFYYRGQDNYGSTKTGAYLCERDVKGLGDRPNRTGR